MPGYIIDCGTLTMNTTVTNDKLGGNVMLELKNVDLSQKGRFKKRYGLEDASNSGTPDVPETRINAIQPVILGDLGSTNNAFLIAFADDKIYNLRLTPAPWVDLSVTIEDTFPWQAAWGIDSAGRAVTYFAAINGDEPIIAVDGITGVVVKYGFTSDASNPWTNGKAVEFFQSKLFVGNVLEGSTSIPNKLWFSVTGDDNDFYTNLGEDSGFLIIRDSGGGTNVSKGIKALRVFRDNLYIATGVALRRLIGDSAVNYGHEYIRGVNSPNGATMFASGDFLFWLDMDGIWQFNGSTARNIATQFQFGRWRTLLRADIANATATYDDEKGRYSVYFPTKGEMWNFNYKSEQWSIDTFSSTDAINVISAPMNNLSSNAVDNVFALGTVTNGKVYRLDPDLNTDDGNAITASMTTGNIRLGREKKRFVYERMDIEAVKQTNAGSLKVTPTIDGVAQTQATLTILAGAPDTFPTMYDGRGGTQIDFLGMQKTGRYAQFKFEDDDIDALADIRMITIETKDID